MAVSANTNRSIDNKVMREDLQEALISIITTETPFQSAIGTKDTDNTHFEWAEVGLQNPDPNNRVLEGEENVTNDQLNQAVRYANHVQLSDKVVAVTSTNEVVNGVGDNHKMAKQVAMKLKELKKDMEVMALANIGATPRAEGVIGVSAGLPSFLRTNVLRGVGGANAPLSGGTTGYPTGPAVDGTLRALTEYMVQDVIEMCWNEGAEPSMLLVGGKVKTKISRTFTGAATKQREQTDKSIVTAIDVLVSDFGDVTVVPTRLGRQRDVLVLDPDYARMVWLQKTKQKDLAETGHGKRKLIWNEHSLQVDSERAHGLIADIDPAL